jgi:hypothetical protein
VPHPTARTARALLCCAHLKRSAPPVTPQDMKRLSSSFNSAWPSCDGPGLPAAGSALVGSGSPAVPNAVCNRLNSNHTQLIRDKPGRNAPAIGRILNTPHLRESELLLRIRDQPTRALPILHRRSSRVTGVAVSRVTGVGEAGGGPGRRDPTASATPSARRAARRRSAPAWTARRWSAALRAMS